MCFHNCIFCNHVDLFVVCVVALVANWGVASMGSCAPSSASRGVARSATGSGGLFGTATASRSASSHIASAPRRPSASALGVASPRFALGVLVSPRLRVGSRRRSLRLGLGSAASPRLGSASALGVRARRRSASSHARRGPRLRLASPRCGRLGGSRSGSAPSWHRCSSNSRPSLRRTPSDVGPELPALLVGAQTPQRVRIGGGDSPGVVRPDGAQPTKRMR